MRSRKRGLRQKPYAKSPPNARQTITRKDIVEAIIILAFFVLLGICVNLLIAVLHFKSGRR